MWRNSIVYLKIYTYIHFTKSFRSRLNAKKNNRDVDEIIQAACIGYKKTFATAFLQVKVKHASHCTFITG